MPDRPHLLVQPGKRRIPLEAHVSVLDLCRDHGIAIESTCGGHGVCGKCRVRVVRGADEPTEADRNVFTDDELASGWRLACRLRLDHDAEIAVPEPAAPHAASILVEGRRVQIELQTNVRTFEARLSPPTLHDTTSDARRFLDALTVSPRPTINPAVLAVLPRVLREHAWHVTATVCGDEVVHVGAAERSATRFGVAFDIGTTTVVGSLVDLATGAERAVAAGLNAQRPYGEDVISRIQHCRSDPDGLQRLHRLITDQASALVEELTRQAHIEPWAIAEIVAVGNPTMTHLLSGVDPSAIGELPYVAATDDAVHLAKRTNDFARLSAYSLVVAPNISGFIGSDIVTGMLVHNLSRADAVTLYVDIGTNAEIVLGGHGHLLVTNAAAGPAFEGGRIECGMPALPGAISGVAFDTDDLALTVVGGGEPRGLCGSGLIDLTALLLDRGLIDPSGRLLAPDETGHNTPLPLRKRLAYTGSQPRFRVSSAVHLSQRDIRQLQAAKAAIAAGIRMLLDHEGVPTGAVERVLLAGAFGSFINPRSAQRIGLIPKVPLERVEPVGNAALAGARIYLLSLPARRRACEVRRWVTVHEMSTDPAFADAFAARMAFD